MTSGKAEPTAPDSTQVPAPPSPKRGRLRMELLPTGKHRAGDGDPGFPGPHNPTLSSVTRAGQSRGGRGQPPSGGEG